MIVVAGSRRSVVGLTFLGAVVFALLFRGPSVFGIAALFVLFVPLEKAFALRRQRVFRPGFLTDLTHLLVNSFFVTGTMLMMPGLRPTVMAPLTLAPRLGMMPSGRTPEKSAPK